MAVFSCLGYPQNLMRCEVIVNKIFVLYDNCTVLLIELAMTNQTVLESNLICGTLAVYTVPG